MRRRRIRYRQLLRAKTIAMQRPGESTAGTEDRREVGVRFGRDDRAVFSDRQAQFAPLDAPGLAAVLSLAAFAGALGWGLAVLASAVRTAPARSRNSS